MKKIVLKRFDPGAFPSPALFSEWGMPRGLYLESRRAAFHDHQRTLPTRAKNTIYVTAFFNSFLGLILWIFPFF